MGHGWPPRMGAPGPDLLKQSSVYLPVRNILALSLSSYMGFPVKKKNKIRCSYKLAGSHSAPLQWAKMLLP